MKKIEAIIRKTKFQEVKDTLHDSGIDFFSFFPVTRVGKPLRKKGWIYTNMERVLIIGKLERVPRKPHHVRIQCGEVSERDTLIL